MLRGWTCDMRRPISKKSIYQARHVFVKVTAVIVKAKSREQSNEVMSQICDGVHFIIVQKRNRESFQAKNKARRGLEGRGNTPTKR